MLAPPGQPGAGVSQEIIDKIKASIQTGKKSVRERNALGQTALHYAAINGSLALAEFLVDHGSDVEAATINLSTPLLFAARMGSVAVVDLLLKRGADVRQRSVLGKSAVHVAIEKGHVAVLERLLQDSRADVNDEDLQGRTALHAAVESDDPNLVQALLQRNASLVSVWEDGDDELTPLDLAVRRADNGSAPAVEIAQLLEKANRDRDEAAKKRDAQLLEQRNKRRTAQREFFLASYFGSIEGMEKQLAAGEIECDVRNVHGNTALHECVEEGRLEAIEYLLSKGASLSAKDIAGSTAVHLCAAKLAVPVLAVLLQAATPAHVQERNCNGESPLHVALNFKLNIPERAGIKQPSPQPAPMVGGGIRHGLPSIGNLEQLGNLQMSRVTSSLDMSRLGAQRPDEMEPLTPPPPGFILQQQHRQQRSSPHLAEDHETALQLAAMVEVVGMLVHAGADPWIKDLKGRSAVQVAVERGLLGPLATMLGAGQPVDEARRERFEEAAVLAQKAGVPEIADAIADWCRGAPLAAGSPAAIPAAPPPADEAGPSSGGSHHGERLKEGRRSLTGFLPLIDEAAFCTRCPAAPAAEEAPEVVVPKGPPPPPLAGPCPTCVSITPPGAPARSRRASIAADRTLPRVLGGMPDGPQGQPSISVPGVSAPRRHGPPGGLPRNATLPVKPHAPTGEQKRRAADAPARTDEASALSKTAFQSLLALWKAGSERPGPSSSEPIKPPLGNARPPPVPVHVASPPSA